MDIQCNCCNKAIACTVAGRHVYNYFTTPQGKKIIFNGWKKAEVLGTVDGSIKLTPENYYPFQTIISLSCKPLPSFIGNQINYIPSKSRRAKIAKVIVTLRYRFHTLHHCQNGK